MIVLYCMTGNMDYRQWTISDKTKTFKMFLLQDKLDPAENLLKWINMICYIMTTKLEYAITSLMMKMLFIKEYKVLHQLQILQNNMSSLLDKCKSNSNTSNFQCKDYMKYCLCGKMSKWSPQMSFAFCKTTTVNSVVMCQILKDDIDRDCRHILSEFLTSWLAELYYVRNLYIQDLSIYVNTDKIKKPNFNDIREWELICEDEDTQILSHPLLPHPSDFLIRNIIKGNRYLDKAGFEYKMSNNSITMHTLCFTKTPSIVPKMIKKEFREENVILTDNKNNINNGSSMYYETTSTSRSFNKKKRPLSRIMKETRKKKKTKWVSKRLDKNQSRITYPLDYDEDEYGEPDYDDDYLSISSQNTY